MKKTVKVTYNADTLQTKIIVDGQPFDTSRINGKEIADWAYPFMMRKVKWNGFYDEMVGALGGEKAFDLVFKGSEEALAELKEAWEDAPVTIIFDEDTADEISSVSDMKHPIKSRSLLIPVILVILVVLVLILSVVTVLLFMNQQQNNTASSVANVNETMISTEIETAEMETVAETTTTTKMVTTTHIQTTSTAITTTTAKTVTEKPFTLSIPNVTPFEDTSSSVGNGKCYTISWNAVDGADGYEVFVEYNQEGETDNYIRRIQENYYTVGASISIDYTCKVRAYASNGSQTVYSDWSTSRSVSICKENASVGGNFASKGQINTHGGSVDGYTTSYVCYGGSFEVQHHVQDTWHITAKNVYYSYGITWYECWDTDDGDYYGWIDANYIDFY